MMIYFESASRKVSVSTRYRSQLLPPEPDDGLLEHETSHTIRRRILSPIYVGEGPSEGPEGCGTKTGNQYEESLDTTVRSSPGESPPPLSGYKERKRLKSLIIFDFFEVLS